MLAVDPQTVTCHIPIEYRYCEFIHTYSNSAVSHSGSGGSGLTASTKITWEMLLKGKLTETERDFFTILSNADAAGFHLGKVVSL